MFLLNGGNVLMTLASDIAHYRNLKEEGTAAARGVPMSLKGCEFSRFGTLLTADSAWRSKWLAAIFPFQRPRWNQQTLTLHAYRLHGASNRASFARRAQPVRTACLSNLFQMPCSFLRFCESLVV